MNNIAIFCGSASGNNDLFYQQAFELGKQLAIAQKNIIYGGAKIGLMGAVANGALSVNGTVIGVIPAFLKQKEIVHEGLSELIEVTTMHERKLKMHDLSDAIITLPGGFGTFEELFEMLTWAQLQLHFNPIALLNIDGFYNPLIQMLDNMTQAGFLQPTHRNLLIVANDIPNLFSKLSIENA